jgi:ribosomal protein S18 acetylase RimI-like enzyme
MSILGHDWQGLVKQPTSATFRLEVADETNPFGFVHLDLVMRDSLNEVIGCCELSENGEFSEELGSATRRLFISRLWVHPEYRRQGHARYLVFEARKIAGYLKHDHLYGDIVAIDPSAVSADELRIVYEKIEGAIGTLPGGQTSVSWSSL